MADSKPIPIGSCFCVVKGCSYNSRKLKAVLNQPCYEHQPTLRKNCGCPPPYTFFQPQSDDERRQYLSKLLLKHPPKKLDVCSFHFVDRRPTYEHPLPELHLGHGVEWKISNRRILSRVKEATGLTLPPNRKRRQVQVDDPSAPVAKTSRNDGKQNFYTALAIQSLKVFVKFLKTKNDKVYFLIFCFGIFQGWLI